MAFLAQLARTYPTVRDFIVGNEPNKPLGWLPQFDSRNRAVSCSSYAGVLAASYDALKAVDQRITVIGLALGARGNDNPAAGRNESISPVKCIRDVGRAYRASKRRRPLMDEISLHPYPNNAADSLETGYRWPNAGVPNLARIKQAVWDAFNGTAQPIFAEPGAPLRTMKVRLNEVGWQVAIPPGSQAAYYGNENVPLTDDGNQAAIYGNLIPYLACDASVRSLLFFNMVDAPNLDGWQSGLLRLVDAAPLVQHRQERDRLALDAVQPPAGRLAARAGRRRRQGEVPRSETPRRERETAWTFNAAAEESATFTAGLFPATSKACSRRQSGRRSRARCVDVGFAEPS